MHSTLYRKKNLQIIHKISDVLLTNFGHTRTISIDTSKSKQNIQIMPRKKNNASLWDRDEDQEESKTDLRCGRSGEASQDGQQPEKVDKKWRWQQFGVGMEMAVGLEGERGCIIRATTSDMRKWGSRRQAAWGRIWWPRHRGRRIQRSQACASRVRGSGEGDGRREAGRRRYSPRRLTAARAHGSSAVSRAWIGDWRWDLRPERRKWAIDGVNGERESRSQQRADGHYKLSPRQFFLASRSLPPAK